MVSSEAVHHIPYAVVPLLGIIGAAALIMVCWVIYRHAHDVKDTTRLPISDEQAIYMREVRNHNIPHPSYLTWLCGVNVCVCM